MKKVQIYEIREHLAKYLAEAESGEEIVIMDHSKTIARLLPADHKKSAFPDLTEFTINMDIKDKSVSGVIKDAG